MPTFSSEIGFNICSICRLAYCKFRNIQENLYSQIALKDIFATLKFRNDAMIYLHQLTT